MCWYLLSFIIGLAIGYSTWKYMNWLLEYGKRKDLKREMTSIESRMLELPFVDRVEFPPDVEPIYCEVYLNRGVNYGDVIFQMLHVEGDIKYNSKYYIEFEHTFPPEEPEKEDE